MQVRLDFRRSLESGLHSSPRGMSVGSFSQTAAGNRAYMQVRTAFTRQYDNKHGFCTADFGIHWLYQDMAPRQYYHSKKTLCDPKWDKQKPSPIVLQLSLANILINPGAAALEVLHTLPKPYKGSQLSVS